MISVSQLIWKIRTTVKARSREGALHLTAEEAAAIDRNLLTIQAIALDQEEEIGLLQAQLADAKRTGVPIVDADGGNVIRLPVRVRAVAVSDGGDAA